MQGQRTVLKLLLLLVCLYATAQQPSLKFETPSIISINKPVGDESLPVLNLKKAVSVPPGYYDATIGLEGELLKNALHEIIKGHTEFPYTASSTDTWDILKESDRDTSNQENLILFYTSWSVNAEQEYNSGNGWSREHVWAKSHGDFGTSKGAGTDLHHLRPADISVNSARNNKDFDIGGEIYVDGDGTTACKTDNDSWEPQDGVKGDVARMLFYMAVRYEGENGEPELELIDDVNTVDLNQPGIGYHGKLSSLMKWHKDDPVDSFEIRRNNVIYNYQNNRNPFIDHPEFALSIWDNTTTVGLVNEEELKVYPNPVKDILHIRTNTPVKGEIYSLKGEKLFEFETTGNHKVSVESLETGVYFLKIKTKKQVYKSKLIIY